MTLEEIKALPNGTILKYHNDQTDFIKQDDGLFCKNYSPILTDTLMVWELVDILKSGFTIQ